MSAPVTRSDLRASGGKDYGYSNARIRGMRSRLFDRTFFDGLIAAPDIQHLIQDLTQTEYGPDLEDSLIHGRDAAAVDEALKANLIRTYQKVLGFLNQEAEMLVTTLLGRWDVFNIKTVLRGKHLHASVEEVREGLLPLGRLSLIDLEALAMVEDVRAVVDTAVTWQLPYSSALREGYGAFLRSGELADMELALDRHYTSWAETRLRRRGANTKLARRMLAMRVDITNLVMVFRLQMADMDRVNASGFFLEGGAEIGHDLYVELAGMSDVDEVLDRLRGTTYGQTLDDAAMRYLESNSIAVFERALEDRLFRKAIGFGTGDPLGIGVAISYLWAKQNEITNLRIVVKGKSVGMPVERVRGELILV